MNIAGTGTREQFNILTAFLDASQVYGSEPERAEELRMFNRGEKIDGFIIKLL